MARRMLASRYLTDEVDKVPLVLHKPDWQLRVCLVSMLTTPLLYRLHLILVTIGYTLCSIRRCSDSLQSKAVLYILMPDWAFTFMHSYAVVKLMSFF